MNDTYLLDALRFATQRRAELDVIRQADAVLDELRHEILAIRIAHSRTRGDELYKFVCSMDFFRPCEYAQKYPHTLRHEYCRMIRRQRGEIKAEGVSHESLR